MKVVYVKTISEKIREEILKARSLNKEIDHIILTEGEYDQLRIEQAKLFGSPLFKTEKLVLIHGVRVEVDYEGEF